MTYPKKCASQIGFKEADIPARQLFVWNQQTYFFDVLEVDKAGKRVKIGIVPKLDEL